MAGTLNSNIPGSVFNDTKTEGQIVTGEGFILPSAKAISVKNVGAVAGVFDGLAIDPAEVFNYPFCGKTYPLITFNATGTQFKIIVFR